MVAGTERQETSKLRIVSLSIVPARYMPETLLCIASKASLLNFRFLVMTYLHQFFQVNLLRDIHVRFPGIETCQGTETNQLFVINIGSILLGEEINKHPISAAFRQDDGTVQIPAQALLVHATAEVIGLTQHDLPDGRTKLLGRDQRLPCRFGKPSCFENAP
jgi:hypothetical protein